MPHFMLNVPTTSAARRICPPCSPRSTRRWRRPASFRWPACAAAPSGSTRQMADGKQDYAFVHMTLKIGHGRTLESRQQVGEMLFALIRNTLPR